MIMEDKRQTYYYVTLQSTELGKELMHLIRRYDEAMQAADKLAVERCADEWVADPRYVAGGICRLIFNNPPKDEAALKVLCDKDGNYVCSPNLDSECGLCLATEMAALPHVTYDDVCKPFGFDPHSAKYKNQLVPQFFVVGTEWVYVRSSFDLSELCSDLTPCSEETFNAALRFIEEQESPTLISEE